jgi:hypothetical protein
VILVGPRENIFHTLPQVEHYPDWPRLVMTLAAERDLQAQFGPRGLPGYTSEPGPPQ